MRLVMNYGLNTFPWSSEELVEHNVQWYEASRVCNVELPSRSKSLTASVLSDVHFILYNLYT